MIKHVVLIVLLWPAPAKQVDSLLTRTSHGAVATKVDEMCRPEKLRRLEPCCDSKDGTNSCTDVNKWIGSWVLVKLVIYCIYIYLLDTSWYCLMLTPVWYSCLVLPEIAGDVVQAWEALHVQPWEALQADGVFCEGAAREMAKVWQRRVRNITVKVLAAGFR